MRVLIVQTCVPDYRVALFNEVYRRLNGSMKVAAGCDFFTPGLVVITAFDWLSIVKNRYFLSRRLCWQHGRALSYLDSEVAIFEFNPRVLSSVVGVALRLALRKPVVLWGHLESMRGVRSALGVVWRAAMLTVAQGFVAYTERQLGELRRRGYRGLAVAIGNSNVSVSDVAPVLTSGVRRSILYIGRLIPDKRVDLLLEAFAAFSVRSEAQWMIEVVGDGPCAASLSRMAEALLPRRNYKFHGHKSSAEDLAQIFGRTYLGVSPGYIGLAAIQSFSYGVPMIIADDERHAPEIEACEPGYNCEFFVARNVNALADAMFRNAGSWRFAPRSEIQRRALSDYAVERCGERLSCIAEALSPKINPRIV